MVQSATMQASTAAGWDRHATTYAKLFAPLTGYIARAMLQLIAPKLPARAHLLDIACGTGALTVPAIEWALHERATTGAAGMVTASDFSPGMVEYTRKAATACGADAELLRCDVQNGEALTYDDASFDAVGSSFGIFLFDDRVAGWREAARVLRPGGLFVTSVWQGPETNMMLRAQTKPVLEALPAHLLPSNARSWIEISRADALIAEVTTAAPLTDARCFPFQASLVLPNAQATFDAMVDNPVIGALLRQCSPEEFAVVRENVLASFVELAGGADQPVIFDSACNILVARRA